MTNEEAIERIKDHMRVHGIGEPPHIYIEEALFMAIGALEKQTQAKATCKDYFYGQEFNCPSCDTYFGFNHRYPKYCPNCGQALDWSE